MSEAENSLAKRILTAKDLLFEIGTEELPAKTLVRFANQLKQTFQTQLTQAKLSFSQLNTYATPRRLAIVVKDLAVIQEDYRVEKKGPALQLAFNHDGQPTQAALGFARSCGVSIEELYSQQMDFRRDANPFAKSIQTQPDNHNHSLIYRAIVKGQTTASLLPNLCHQAIAHLAIPKPMRWNDSHIAFIRPVHWIVLLFGNEVIQTHILGLATSDESYGHRFHHPYPIKIKNPADYESSLLSQGYVIADFNERRNRIFEQATQLATQLYSKQMDLAHAIIDESLLDEVTGLVEWPVALLAKFDEDFLKIPKEVLISAMQTHQKAFAIADNNGTLLPYFIAVANIASKKPEQVIQGNERVMRARLADAAFFYRSDCKHSLESFLERLKGVIFQAKLGTVYQQAERIASLAEFIAAQLQIPTHLTARAGLLAKADLTSEMVGEFPELQGIMGYYYALNDGLPEAVAIAIREHYLPRFAGDKLPDTLIGASVALAEKLDKLIGIFGINQAPTGDKDPFALRRAATGIIRICIEKNLDLDLKQLLQTASLAYKDTLINKKVVPQVYDFILERLRTTYLDLGIGNDVVNAVIAREINSIYDFHLRVLAVDGFRRLPEADSLASANKRVSNILNKKGLTQQSSQSKLDANLFEKSVEQELARLLQEKATTIQPLYKEKNYTGVLKELVVLRVPIDQFFDEVMVMVPDERIRNNRLALLQSLRQLFLQVADIAYLQGNVSS